jgi:hypothetical protein
MPVDLAMAEVPAIASPPGKLDRKAILARAEHTIDLLRTSYVCEGWHEGVDEEGAARALEYFRLAAEPGYDEGESAPPEFDVALDFLQSHGIDLNWMFGGDIDSMITHGAARSARAAAIQARA